MDMEEPEVSHHGCHGDVPSDDFSVKFTMGVKYLSSDIGNGVPNMWNALSSVPDSAAVHVAASPAPRLTGRAQFARHWGSSRRLQFGVGRFGGDTMRNRTSFPL